jgi:hypothetical protein
MKDVMLDFETFGNGKNAAVCQVGAVFFDRKTGALGKEFFCNIDARSTVKSGGEIDADTVYWWLDQKQEARDALKGQQFDINVVFKDLNEFLGNADAIWSHATFDFVILQETMKRLGIKPKYSYRSARDLRTLNDLAPKDTDAGPFAGTPHNALDDCRNQIKYCVAALNRISK